MQSAALTGRKQSAVAMAFAALPTGHLLRSEDWRVRHRAITGLLWLHVLAVPIYGLLRGHSVRHAVLETSAIAALASGACWRALRPTTRSVMATLGLVSASAVLTHFSGGLIEVHFHFFVVVAVISLYQSWVPFLTALAFVVVHHAVGGVLSPSIVYNHPDAVRQSLLYALVHGGFILAESIACLVAWRLNEVALMSERLARHDLEKANRDLAAAQALSSIGSWDWYPDPERTWWSDELYRIVGHHPGGLEPGLERFLDCVAELDRQRVAAAVEQALLDQGTLDVECAIIRPDGTRRTIHARGQALVEADGHLHLVGTVQDITDRKVLEEEVRHRANHDALTGLANRAVFLTRLEQALALSASNGGVHALLYLDVDAFKEVNDSLGHSMGDQLLVALADRLRALVRGRDTVARLGGDEFAILLEGCDAAGAAAIADKLLEVLREPMAIAGTRLLVRASIGIAVADASTAPGDLLRHADIAMYTAKRQGAHGHLLFNESMHSSLRARMELEAELAEALAQEQFVLHYQPVVDLTTGAIDGVEALVRWDHPRRGVLPPSEFIPVAEETGLVTALGEWVLHQATGDLRMLQAALGPALYVSVNVAATQLHENLHDTVLAALEQADLDPRHLVLEITETSLMSQEESSVDQLARLRRLGVRVAIDDFGTGYSSLAYLRRLPIDHLKIDRAFVRDITTGPEESALAQAIIRLGTLFDLRVVGEGIETTEQAELLRRFGCHAGQGYHYHRPADLDALLTSPPVRALAAVG